MRKNETFYDLLKNKEWLETKYIKEKLSLNKISKIVGCKSSNSVRQALIKHKIKIRSISDGLTINNEILSINKDIIDGCLLGDGGLLVYNRLSDKSYPFFYKKNIYIDHIEYIAKHFYKDYKKYIKLEHTKLNNKIYPINVFTTRSNKDLAIFYKRWYPKSNNFIKIIPKDIDINKTVLLNWFMDDGSSSYRLRMYKGKKQIRKKQIRITFCTNCFSLEDQNFLCDVINKNFNLKAKTSPHKNTYMIKIPQSKAFDFFDILGECPVKSMEYKWKNIY